MEYDGQTEKLIAIMGEVDKLYNEDTHDSLEKIYRKDYPEILDILYDFTQTECGKATFGRNASKSVKESKKILETTEFRIKKFTSTINRRLIESGRLMADDARAKQRTEVFLNGDMEFDSYFYILKAYYKVINEAVQSGSFKKGNIW